MGIERSTSLLAYICLCLYFVSDGLYFNLTHLAPALTSPRSCDGNSKSSPPDFNSCPSSVLRRVALRRSGWVRIVWGKFHRIGHANLPSIPSAARPSTAGQKTEDFKK